MRGPNIRDVAIKAGVSVGTVSNVLNKPHLVSPQTVRDVTQVMNDLGYLRNDAARQLRGGDSRSIGMIVLDSRNPFFADVARGAEDAAEEHGQVVLLGSSAGQTDREMRYLNAFAERRVLGILLSPVADLGPSLERLRHHRIPTVLVDRLAQPGTTSSVSVDDFAGGRRAAEHLLESGRQRLAFVGGPHALRQVSDRLAGARSAVEAVTGATLEVLVTPALTVEAGRDAAGDLADRAPAKRPDGVFAANDLVAMGLLQRFAMKERVHVPEDIAVVGYDDIDFARAAVVPLTSLRQPRELMGRRAVELLRDEIEDPTLQPRRVIFQPDLIARASTTVV